MFKNSVIENKKKKDFLKKQRLNVIDLRNKFLAEWASNILELNDKEKLTYIKKVTNAYFKKEENKFAVKKIEDDFARRNIKISFKEIELKIKDFQIKANIIVENKFKLSNWK
ncbi:DUF1476 domain-containing protein [Alphaproteobacteria bacterium]|nr:DUF1476 domain-containing protein [Alphaproteobacteria bacterium]